MKLVYHVTCACAAAVLLCPRPAAAQFGDGLTQTAIGVQAYEKSADRCFYEPIVGRALERLREHYDQAEPYRWRRAVRESVDADDMLRNLMGLAMQGSPYTVDPNARAASKPAVPADKDCAASGLAVGAALPFAGSLIGFDPVLFGEATRLMDGKGRTMATLDTNASGAAGARPGDGAGRTSARAEPRMELVVNSQSPFRGATFVDASPAEAREAGIDAGHGGVVLTSCERDANAMCGNFRRGDVITEVDGVPISDVVQFSKITYGLRKVWTVTFFRGGKRMTSALPG